MLFAIHPTAKAMGFLASFFVILNSDFIWLLFHETDPVGVCPFAGDMPEDGFVRSQFQNLGYFYVCLVPFENKKSSFTEDSEAFGKAFFQYFFPAVSREGAVLDYLPAAGFLFIAGKFQVRRIEDHHGKGLVREGHGREVTDDVRVYFEMAPIAEVGVQFPYVLEEDTGVFLVEVEHSAAAAGVENGREFS